MTRTIRARPLDQAAFAPFGDVLAADGEPDKLINAGRCGRYHDRARLDFGEGRAGISVFHGEPETLPLAIALMERHPLGSQAFVPMACARWLVVVAPDADGVPGTPVAFLARADQGVNLLRNVWHGVFCPLDRTGLFAVIDRIGTGNNLVLHHFETPWRVEE